MDTYKYQSDSLAPIVAACLAAGVIIATGLSLAMTLLLGR